MEKEPKKSNSWHNSGIIQGSVNVVQSLYGNNPVAFVAIVAIVGIVVIGIALIQSNGSGNNDAEKILTNIQITSMKCKSKSEIVVIENVGNSSQDLTDWTIEDQGPNYTFKFEDDFYLKPGSSVKLISGESGNNSTESIYWNIKPVWNNAGDTANLYNSSGELVSEMKCP